MAKLQSPYSPKALRAAAFAVKEERKERYETEVAFLKERAEHMKRQRENQPKEDPESLKLVSQETLDRMAKEVGGHPMKGLKVVAEKGQQPFSDKSPFISPATLMEHLLNVQLRIPDASVLADGDLLRIVEGEHPLLPRERVPIVTLKKHHVIRARLDANATEEERYITEAEVQRIRDEYGIQSPAIFDALRQQAAAQVSSNKAFLTLGECVMTRIPLEEVPALLALPLVQRDMDTQVTALRVHLPLDATQNYGLHVMTFIVQHFVTVTFKPLKEDHVYVWATFLRSFEISLENPCLELFIVFGQRDKRRMLQRMEKYEESYIKLLEEEKALKEQAEKAKKDAERKEEEEELEDDYGSDRDAEEDATTLPPKDVTEEGEEETQ